MNDMKVWRKGDKAPGRGVPYRHVRDKAQLLLDDCTSDQLYAVIRTLLEHDPRPVLDALCAVTDPDGKDAGQPGTRE